MAQLLHLVRERAGLDNLRGGRLAVGHEARRHIAELGLGGKQPTHAEVQQDGHRHAGHDAGSAPYDEHARKPCDHARDGTNHVARHQL